MDFYLGTVLMMKMVGKSEKDSYIKEAKTLLTSFPNKRSFPFFPKKVFNRLLSKILDLI